MDNPRNLVRRLKGRPMEHERDALDRQYETHLSRHPDCHDPDHPGCKICDEDRADEALTKEEELDLFACSECGEELKPGDDGYGTEWGTCEKCISGGGDDGQE